MKTRIMQNANYKDKKCRATEKNIHSYLQIGKEISLPIATSCFVDFFKQTSLVKATGARELYQLLTL